MKLKTFTKQDCQSRCAWDPQLRITKTGAILFSKTALEKLQLYVGERIYIHQDEDEPIDWYISKTKNKDGLVFKGDPKKTVRVSAARIARHMLKSTGNEGKTPAFRIATEPTEVGGINYYAILTRSAKP